MPLRVEPCSKKRIEIHFSLKKVRHGIDETWLREWRLTAKTFHTIARIYKTDNGREIWQIIPESPIEMIPNQELRIEQIGLEQPKLLTLSQTVADHE